MSTSYVPNWWSMKNWYITVKKEKFHFWIYIFTPHLLILSGIKVTDIVTVRL